MRIFVALDIPDSIRAAIARYMEGLRNFAPEVKWVRPESLHLTLKFIGEQKEDQVEHIKRALAALKSAPFEIAFHDTGFFPNAKRPRVFWVGIEAPDALAQIAIAVDEAVSRCGVARETNSYSPHLTLARAGSGRPYNRPGDRPDSDLRRLADRLQPLPPPDPGSPGRAGFARPGVADFGTMTAREFYLYESKLSPSGARYTKLQAFPLVASP